MKPLSWISDFSLQIYVLPQGSPHLRFNKDGSLLAVTTSDNGIKILANADGMRLLRMLESRAFDVSRGQPDVKVSLLLETYFHTMKFWRMRMRF